MRIVDDKQVPWEELEDLADSLLEHPSDSLWRDEELWHTHTLLFGTPDPTLTDDYLGDYANYRYALAQLEDNYKGDVEEATFGHWTYSRFVAIKVRVRDEEGELTEAFIEAITLWQLAQEEGVLDWDTYSEELSRVESEQVDYLATEHKVDRDILFDVLTENGSYNPGYGWDMDEDEAVAEAKRRAQTWQAHYYSGQFHEPEACEYCARAVEVSA